MGLARTLDILLKRDRFLPALIGIGSFAFAMIAVALNIWRFGPTPVGLVPPTFLGAITLLVAFGAGTLIARYLAFGGAEPGFAVFGAAGSAFFCSLLLAANSIQQASVIALFVWFFLGFGMGSLFLFLFKNALPEERWPVCICMISAAFLKMAATAVLMWLLAVKLNIGPKPILAGTGLLLLATGVYLFWRMQDYFIRAATKILTRIVFRVHIVGQENIPTHGPALICSNHISFADGNLLLTAIPRNARFVVWQGHYHNRLLKWLGEATQAITVDPHLPPKQLVQSLRNASEALQNGEVVAVFPEGSISRTGNLLPFQRGIEVVLKKCPDVPVIPVYIEGMWPGYFSFSGGRFFKKRIKSWFAPVIIKFGKPVSATLPACELRREVRKLWSECFEERKQFESPLPHQFIRTAKRIPRCRCMADATTEPTTFSQTLMRAAILSRMLKRKLGPEECVGLFIPPSVGTAMANLAVSFLGKIPVNLNYTTGQEVLNHCVRQSGIKQVITSKRFLGKIDLKPDTELILLEDLRKDLKTTDKLFGLAARFSPAWFCERILFRLPQKIDDLATIIFSSGSTGDPKGVMLTHHNVLSNVRGVIQLVDVDESETVLGVLPVFHSFGFTVVLWLPFCSGSSTIYHYSPLEADVVGGLAKKYQATIFLSTATFLRGHIRKSAPEDFQSVRLIVCGAEKLPMKVADQFEEKFKVRPLEGYGCTELSPVVSANRPDVVFNNLGRSALQVAQKQGTIGLPIPGVLVKVVAPETFEELPAGQEGLLLVKGPNVMKGYLHKPEMTAEAIKDGWYNTGDIAKLDADGFITITDRLSRFSKIGGEMVPHGKVEEVLHAVLETHESLCVVVGIPDERKGERLVVLHTSLNITTDELWTRMKEHGLPPLWLPSKGAFHEIDELPVLGTGKLDLKRVKTLALEKTGG